MGRDVTKLHPTLQAKIKQLIKECKAVGITIQIGECLRTVAEQDALYAKGRTAPGSIVTNAKGKSYSSMHQWGVAFDFYLKMDIDGDGKTSDDVYNNATKVFNTIEGGCVCFKNDAWVQLLNDQKNKNEELVKTFITSRD